MPGKNVPPPLLYSDTERSPDALYFGRVHVPDAFIAFGRKGKKYAVVGALEFGRVRKTSAFDVVLPLEPWLQRARELWPERRAGAAEAIFLLAKEYHQTRFTVPEEKLARRGDLLVNSLGEGTLGRVHYFLGTDREWAVDQHMSICRSSVEGLTLFLYMVFSSEEGQARIQSLKTGGTNMTMFNISRLRDFPILFPGGVLVQSFFNLVKPAWDLKRTLEEMNRVLRTARDLLLPGLVSGQLDVFDLDIDTGDLLG